MAILAPCLPLGVDEFGSRGDMEEQERKAVTNLLSVIAEVRKEDKEMPVHTLMVVCLVALHPGITMAQVVEHLEVTGPTVTRIVDRLSRRKKYNVPGLDLIMRSKDEATDQRFTGLYLTPKGHSFVKRISAVRTR